jgi:hypothetical protein
MEATVSCAVLNSGYAAEHVNLISLAEEARSRKIQRISSLQRFQAETNSKEHS